jgi:RPA family protein
MAGFVREVAHRVFAKELRDTEIVLDKDENDSYAVTYVMTPTGAKVNRVFVVGTLTEIEDIGSDSEYWRARVQDPTGVHIVYAGQYQLEAARVLSEVEIPAILAIVGKAAVYEPDNGGVVVSIRPETVTVVDSVARDTWVYQTAQQTLDRIRRLEADSPDTISDMKPYREMVRASLAELIE